MDSLKYISRDDIDNMDRVPRLKLINALSGFKSANLIGTINTTGVENLAIFSSVFHLGSDPPLLGCILRPKLVPRHTYDNLKATGWYTINHINEEIYQQAHQTSGKYREDISEFNMTDLTSFYSGECEAPYVKEANIRIGLKFLEEHLVQTNNTYMIVGSIEQLMLPADCFEDDGFFDIEKAGTLTISGLDAYHKTKRIDKLDYVRVDKSVKREE
ncbi:MAG: flavin reductase [Balneolaceae bacterium]|nr:flavin reductase [Balneolaceae bacterium]